jgi:hypothetical protein
MGSTSHEQTAMLPQTPDRTFRIERTVGAIEVVYALVAASIACGAAVSIPALPWLDANLSPSGVSESAAVILAAVGVVATAIISTIVPAVRLSGRSRPRVSRTLTI